MRLVVVFPEPVLPPTSGGRVHALGVANTARLLGHDLVIVCPTGGLRSDADGIRVVQVEIRPSNASYMPWRAALAFKRWFDPLALTGGRRWRRLVASVLAEERPDAIIWIHMYSWFSTGWPSLLISQNAETDRFRRTGGNMPWQLRAVRKREVKALHGATVAAALTSADCDRLRDVSGTDLTLLPAAVPWSPPKDRHGPLERLCYVGSFDYRPNVEAATWLTELLPALKEQAGIVTLTFAGRQANALPASIRELPGVEVVADVEDMREFLRAQDLLVVPLRNGGGVRVKILEAFAVGLPVVSTSIGAEGIRAVSGEDILIADDSDALVAAVASLREPARRRELGEAGRSLWERQHSPRAAAHALDRALSRLLEASAGA